MSETEDSKQVTMVVITGHSGAGKSEAIAAFEDGGFFCVDNLPPKMIGSLGELFRYRGSGVERAAVVSDVRGGEYFDDLVQVLDDLDVDGLAPKVLFLEADEQTLVDRYKETRRRHPMAPDGHIVDGIRAERELLAPLRERADVVMDTSGLSGGLLRRRIAEEMLSAEGNGGRMALTLQTFGFKNGPPRDADLTLDVRFLPNPHYVDELRPLTGLDAAARFPHPRLRRGGKEPSDDCDRLHRGPPPLDHRRRPDRAPAAASRRRRGAGQAPRRRARLRPPGARSLESPS
jgi:RNase adapter protein RapZ